MEKIITVKLAESGTEVSLGHRIINHNVWDTELAAWCLSVMAPGGTVVIPQEEYRSHPECLVPARPLVLWHFTDMSDRRFTWGKKYICMTQDDRYEQKLKIGTANRQGWEAYVLNDEVFIKRHNFIAGKEYPDMGCNAEFFTMPGFLEIESLSPLTRIKPGESLDHEEHWELKKKTVSLKEADLDTLI